MDKPNQHIRLRNGRRLGYAEYGDAKGDVVLYFHGWPGSRLELRAFEICTGKIPARILALERPGFGVSDFQTSRTLLDWPLDVSDFADQLGLKRFALLGASGGGPYAAACAAAIPDRVSNLVLVCPMGPLKGRPQTKDMIAMNRWMLFLARTTPRIGRVLVGIGLERLRRHPDRFISQLEPKLPECDQRALARPGVRDLLLENFREALRTGVEGAIWDGWLYAKPWGFQLDSIRVPTHLWHGEADVIVPPAMARQLAEAIPGCRARFLPNEGHFSLPLNRGQEMLESAGSRS
jgi:pimeloyl-ACP methyl ester carboxylesterase